MLLKKIFNRYMDHNMNKVKSYKPDDQNKDDKQNLSTQNEESK